MCFDFNPAVLLRLTLAAALGAGLMVRAEAQIFLCVDASGAKELTDVRKNNSCKPLDLPGSISAPPKRPAGGGGGVAKAPAVTPAGFPKVDDAQQKARDADRRQILQDELRSEQQRLNDLRKDFNNGEPARNGNERNFAKYQERVAQMKDSISRAEKNVEALNREIANIQ
jgi:hypothetical protein